AEVVNSYEESDLSRLIAENADEKFARRIAKAIVTARPISTTSQLAEVVVAAIPAPARRTGGHPAKRTFQAIRIEVNKELEVLERALQIAIDATKSGGRVAVLTYHSRTRRVRAPKHPSSKEQTLNRRAKSARLRVLEKTLVGVGN
ncbi:MAG: S-adenosyl-L-methionine-dependent methyltransferase MraW, partial [Actinomycetota bacterium]